MQTPASFMISPMHTIPPTKVSAQQGGNSVVQEAGWHGHFVADMVAKGIIEARSKPGAGNIDVKIMPIRMVSTNSSPSYISNSAIIRGIYWAADHGVAVFNISTVTPGVGDVSFVYGSGSPYNNTWMSQTVAYAEGKGSIVVTGAGNGSGLNIDNLNNALLLHIAMLRDLYTPAPCLPMSWSPQPSTRKTISVP